MSKEALKDVSKKADMIDWMWRQKLMKMKMKIKSWKNREIRLKHQNHVFCMTIIVDRNVIYLIFDVMSLLITSI
jgi:hypothetical protein